MAPPAVTWPDCSVLPERGEEGSGKAVGSGAGQEVGARGRRGGHAGGLSAAENTGEGLPAPAQRWREEQPQEGCGLRTLTLEGKTVHGVGHVRWLLAPAWKAVLLGQGGVPGGKAFPSGQSLGVVHPFCPGQ